MTESNRFIFVVDTDSYSGDFEREMCAYITGQVGECGVGSKRIEDLECLKEEHYDFDVDKIWEWFEDHVIQVPDHNGCCRPTSIWETPGRTNNGKGLHSDITKENPYKWPAYESVAIYLGEIPPEDVVRFMVVRANMFQRRLRLGPNPANPIKVKGCRLIKKTTIVKEEVTDINIPLDI